MEWFHDSHWLRLFPVRTSGITVPRGKELKTELGDTLSPPRLFPLPSPMLFLHPFSSPLFSCVHSQPRPCILPHSGLHPHSQDQGDRLPTGPFASSTSLQPGDLPEVQARPHPSQPKARHGTLSARPLHCGTTSLLAHSSPRPSCHRAPENRRSPMPPSPVEAVSSTWTELTAPHGHLRAAPRPSLSFPPPEPCGLTVIPHGRCDPSCCCCNKLAQA